MTISPGTDTPVFRLAQAQLTRSHTLRGRWQAAEFPRAVLSKRYLMTLPQQSQSGVGLSRGRCVHGRLPPWYRVLVRPGLYSDALGVNDRVDQVELGTVPVPHLPSPCTEGPPGSPPPCAASTSHRCGAGSAHAAPSPQATGHHHRDISDIRAQNHHAPKSRRHAECD